MTADRWADVERLFHAACERRPHERAAFLLRECGGDHLLYAEVQSLIDESAPEDSFLEGAVFDAGAPTADSLPAAGRRLGEYQFQSWIGAGGMGEVYRARDLKLGRDVAIKLLPPAVARDADRVARFRREARMLATLNHPHIAAIYALEESDDTLGLVLELVEGPTLADKLREGPLPLADAMTVARETALALEAAHAKGIVHRDLKPANIKLTPEGTVKVLDFGVAKAITAEPGADTIATADVTRDGVIVGTAPYMSPEQARGLPVGIRTDIWAFGCVVYEVFTGRRAFGGETAADCLAAVLERAPDWEALPPSTPPALTALLRQCLEKDPDRRLPDMRAARELLDRSSTTTGTAETAVPRGRSAIRSRVYVAVALTLLLAAVLGARGVMQILTRARVVELPLASLESIVPTHSSEVAVSPDGRLIAYASMTAAVAMPNMNTGRGSEGEAATDATSPPMSAMPMNEQIYLRASTDGPAKPIGGAVGSAPFFSPDGQWLGFWHAPSGTLRKVAVTGGAPVKIASASSGIAGATWGADGSIVFAWFDLFRVSADGSAPALLLKVDEAHGERFYRHPSFLPSGKAVLFTIAKADMDSYDEGSIAVLSLDTHQKKVLIDGGTSPRYLPSGHLIYARAGKLLAVRLDVQKLQTIGQPFEVAEGVFMSATTGMAAYGLSADGQLVYATGPTERGARVPVWVDRHGKATRMPLPPRPYLHPRLSPDEQQLAIEIEGASHDVFIYDFRRGPLSRMTLDGSSHWPLWTPNGKRLTFRSWKTGVMTMWTMPADRSAPAKLLTTIGSMQSPESWSPDGHALAFTQMDDPESGSDIYVLDAGGDGTPRPFVRTKFSEGSPKFSPDGKWLAYSSNESGRPEIYAMAYPGPGPKIQISTAGGTDPVWRHDTKELFYRNGSLMMAVDISSGRALTASRPKTLWEGNYLAGAGSSCGMTGPTSANYDVSADGERFVMIEDTSPLVECKRLHVVPNWAAQVSRRAPAATPVQSSRSARTPVVATR